MRVCVCVCVRAQSDLLSHVSACAFTHLPCPASALGCATRADCTAFVTPDTIEDHLLNKHSFSEVQTFARDTTISIPVPMDVVMKTLGAKRDCVALCKRYLCVARDYADVSAGAMTTRVFRLLTPGRSFAGASFLRSTSLAARSSASPLSRSTAPRFTVTFLVHSTITTRSTPTQRVCGTAMSAASRATRLGASPSSP